MNWFVSFIKITTQILGTKKILKQKEIGLVIFSFLWEIKWIFMNLWNIQKINAHKYGCYKIKKKLRSNQTENFWLFQTVHKKNYRRMLVFKNEECMDVVLNYW